MHRWLGAGVALLLVSFACPGPTQARPPGQEFRLRPAPKPLVPERSPVGTHSGPFALANAQWEVAARTLPPRWGMPEPERVEPAPRPGEWTTSLDPSLDLGAPRGLDDQDPGAELAEMLDPLFVESVTVRVIRHF